MVGSVRRENELLRAPFTNREMHAGFFHFLCRNSAQSGVSDNEIERTPVNHLSQDQARTGFLVKPRNWRVERLELGRRLRDRETPEDWLGRRIVRNDRPSLKSMRHLRRQANRKARGYGFLAHCSNRRRFPPQHKSPPISKDHSSAEHCHISAVAAA